MTLQPTFLQRTLGRNYKWWYLIIYSFKQTNLQLSGFLIGNLASILDALMTIYLWLIIEPTKDRVTYFFVGFILQRLVWSQYSSKLTELIITGKIANLLIMPVSNFQFWLFREIGSASTKNSLTAGLILLFIPFYLNYLRLPLLNYILLFPFLILIAFFVDFCFSYIISAIAFWTEDYRSIGFLTIILVKFLSGIVIPFEYLPKSLSRILTFNPYSYINYHPMQIYLGKYTFGQTLWVFVGGIAWCIILYFSAKFVFKLGLKRNESVGL